MTEQKTISIRELNSQEEWKKAFPVMNQLRTHLDEASYLQLVEEATNKEDYKMAALFENENIVALLALCP
ncbi:hypothetical protein SAMN02799634_10230 [Bacillus sp. UNCCL13]|nr:hypothetical protein SAMN02799634_10230 [Bacillus sp. UNCCL13]